MFLSKMVLNTPSSNFTSRTGAVASNFTGFHPAGSEAVFSCLLIRASSSSVCLFISTIRHVGSSVTKPSSATLFPFETTTPLMRLNRSAARRSIVKSNRCFRATFEQQLTTLYGLSFTYNCITPPSGPVSP